MFREKSRARVRTFRAALRPARPTGRRALLVPGLIGDCPQRRTDVRSIRKTNKKNPAISGGVFAFNEGSKA